MLNLNQLKEREDLRAQQEKLGDELTFAEEHKLPWGFEGWNSSHTCTISCPEHGDYEQFTLVGKDFRGAEAFKHSRCPACIRAEQTSVKSSLRKLHVASLLNDAGITRRFGDCEFENYLELNPEASRNLAACRRYANNWPGVLDAGKSLVLTGSCGTGKKSSGGLSGEKHHPQPSRHRGTDRCDASDSCREKHLGATMLTQPKRAYWITTLRWIC